jgi:hypothetical protein
MMEVLCQSFLIAFFVVLTIGALVYREWGLAMLWSSFSGAYATLVLLYNSGEPVWVGGAAAAGVFLFGIALIHVYGGWLVRKENRQRTGQYVKLPVEVDPSL